MTIGTNLRQTRLSMHLTMKQFAKGALDSSYLSHIERNENEIRATTLIKLLTKNNISVIDFLQEYNSSPIQSSVLQTEASNAFFNHDVETLQKMLKGSAKSSLIIQKIIILMVDRLNKQVSQFSIDDRKIIKRYILEKTSWHNDHLWVIANSLDIYNIKDAHMLIRRITQKYQRFDNYTDRTIKLLAEIIVNYLQICITNGFTDLAPVALDYMDKLPAIPAIFLEKIKAEYLRAIYQENNEKKMTFLQVFETLSNT